MSLCGIQSKAFAFSSRAKAGRALPFKQRGLAKPGRPLASFTPSQQGLKAPKRPSVTTAAAAQETMAPSGSDWAQTTVSLPNHPRGCHIVTHHLLKDCPEISEFEVGLATFFVQHTSCSLTINENASPDVPLDLADWLDKTAPEGRHYRHLDEGFDDMPAHCKSSMMGVSLTIPIQHGRLALGTWQGIYLNEHRDYGGTRKVVVTMQGKKRDDGRKYGR